MLLHTIPTEPKSIPHLPESLRGVSRLAHNFAWAWVPGVRDLFERLDVSWSDGPVAALFAARNLDRLAKDPSFLEAMAEAERRFDAYLAHQGGQSGFPGVVAYFCAEYGIHESFPVYCGGLGILAGDHCKEASDLGLPFVAIGIFYRRGFFRQMIDHEGRQEHEYPRLDPDRTPLERVLRPGTQEPLTVPIEFPGRTVHVAVWRAAVGRVPLLMMDTDLPVNAPEDRPITSQLYMRGRDMRVHQEIVLGVGGVRVLDALGIRPTVWHMNEGHSAFLLLERLRRGESVEAVKGSSVLSIHTPVPEGNERFDADHIASCISAIQNGSPISTGEVLRLGLDSVGDPNVFDMTAFALRLSRVANGVSLLHGRTADGTWRQIAGREVIGVTNGVHMPSWVGQEMRSLDEKLGAEFDPSASFQRTPTATRDAWNGIVDATDAGLWAAHQAQKRRMVQFVRERLVAQVVRHGVGPSELKALGEILDPDAFTIGFARRFAPYKRASLLFSDERRILKLLNSTDRPVQIVFAGKAHPADRVGQKLIAKVFAKTQNRRFRGKVVLVEDYDISVGRALVQGVDLWLNNPRRPLEASGTSGMKAAANGVPNLSVLDGWWDEAFVDGERRNGFAIGDRTTLADPKAQDRADAESLYRQLEEFVIPMYFERDAGGLPSRWLSMMREAIASSLWAFSTSRMIDDYVAWMYDPPREG